MKPTGRSDNQDAMLSVCRRSQRPHPSEFRWSRYWVPELRQVRSRWRRVGQTPERLSAGTRRGAGKSGVAQRFLEMANDQKHLLLIARLMPDGIALFTEL